MSRCVLVSTFNTSTDLKNADEQTEGVGLGMSIAKQIATLHGATLEVHSKIGEGTKVDIYLPKASSL
ncbi:ATP-binding protein [Bacillus thuringiensis]